MTTLVCYLFNVKHKKMHANDDYDDDNNDEDDTDIADAAVITIPPLLSSKTGELIMIYVKMEELDKPFTNIRKHIAEDRSDHENGLELANLDFIINIFMIN